MSETRLEQSVEQEITIRVDKVADISSLALLMERAYAQRDNLPLPATASDAGCQEIELDLKTPGAWAYITKIDNRIGGFAIGFPHSETNDAVSNSSAEYLSLLMVEPEFWGRGIASRLLDIVEHRARQAGRQHLLLWTRQANNSRTQSIYARRKYKRTGKTTNDGLYGPQYQYQLDL